MRTEDVGARGPAAPPSRSAPRSRLGLVKAGVAAAALLAVVLLGRSASGHLAGFAAWIDGLGALGPVVFVAGYALATVAFAPGSVLTLAAGALFGLAGVLVVFVGAVLGGSAAFLIARYLARDVVDRRIASSPRFAAIDRAIAGQGRKIVLLLRLSPVFPFNALNYGLGLTRVRFVDYLVGFAGTIPGTFLYVYYGKLGGDVARLAGGTPAPRGAGYWAVLLLGLVATLVVTTLVTRTARRALKEVTDARA